jgi:hypothetical protein
LTSASPRLLLARSIYYTAIVDEEVEMGAWSWSPRIWIAMGVVAVMAAIGLSPAGTVLLGLAVLACPLSMGAMALGMAWAARRRPGTPVDVQGGEAPWARPVQLEELPAEAAMR